MNKYYNETVDTLKARLDKMTEEFNGAKSAATKKTV